MVVIALTAVPALARADDPWAAGVTEAQKDEAQGMLEQGNALFLEKKYAEALEVYRRADAVWDHPSIRFNMVRCLIQLDRPAEASENLERALKYGSAPLEPSVYEEALAYQKLLANEIAELDVRCTQTGARITLDGQELGLCPLEQKRSVTPGSHQVVGTAAGYVPRTYDVVVVGGAHDRVDVSLESVASAAKIVHRWATWKPWAVFGAGVATTALGIGLQLKASSDMTSYKQQLASECANVGCSPAQAASLAPLRSSALLENHLAVALIPLGIAAAVGGGVMLYLNRPHAVYPSLTEGGATLNVHARF